MTHSLSEGFEAVPRRDGDDVVVFFHGELDLAGASRIARLMNALDGALGARVVLDLADLSFIDASGVGAIERARERMKDEGRQMIVRRPQPAIRRVLELCGVDGWLEPPGELARVRAPALREGFFALSSRAAPRPARRRLAFELGGAPPPG